MLSRLLCYLYRAMGPWIPLAGQTIRDPEYLRWLANAGAHPVDRCACPGCGAEGFWDDLFEGVEEEGEAFGFWTACISRRCKFCGHRVGGYAVVRGVAI